MSHKLSYKLGAHHLLLLNGSPTLSKSVITAILCGVQKCGAKTAGVVTRNEGLEKRLRVQPKTPGCDRRDCAKFTALFRESSTRPSRSRVFVAGFRV